MPPRTLLQDSILSVLGDARIPSRGDQRLMFRRHRLQVLVLDVHLAAFLHGYVNRDALFDEAEWLLMTKFVQIGKSVV